MACSFGPNRSVHTDPIGIIPPHLWAHGIIEFLCPPWTQVVGGPPLGMFPSSSSKAKASLISHDVITLGKAGHRMEGSVSTWYLLSLHGSGLTWWFVATTSIDGWLLDQPGSQEVYLVEWGVVLCPLTSVVRIGLVPSAWIFPFWPRWTSELAYVAPV
jgi:hypothetical protein